MKLVFSWLCVCCAVMFLAPSAHAQPDRIPERVQRVIDGHQLPGTSFSFYVKEIGADTPILSYNAETPMNPASAMKTITTLAALESLGPAFTWQTDLYALGPISDGKIGFEA